MLLLLHRHALAAAADPVRWPDDSLRPLTEKGRRIQCRVSAGLAASGLAPLVVFSSPWKRAWQTARIVAEASGLSKADRIACLDLATPPDLEALATAIGHHPPRAPIALVGHEPWLSDLTSLLLTGRAGGLAVDFPKSGVLGIEAGRLAPRAGVLRFFLRP